MKTKNILTVLALGGALILAGGCSKSEDAAPPTSVTTNKPADAAKPMMEQATNAVAKAVDVVTNLAMPAKAAAVQTAATAMQAATNAVSAATAAATTAAVGSTAQGLIDQAKSLIANKQYQPALDTLAKLSSSQLTPAQQTTVDGLKADIQKLMASDGAKAIGNMLGK